MVSLYGVLVCVADDVSPGGAPVFLLPALDAVPPHWLPPPPGAAPPGAELAGLGPDLSGNMALMMTVRAKVMSDGRILGESEEI